MNTIANEDGVISYDLPDFAPLYADLNIVMSKDKNTIADTIGHFGSYSSFNTVAKKAAEIITGTGIAYFQTADVQSDWVEVQTFITHSSGVKLPTGVVRIPLQKRDPKDIASSLSWAKRLSLISAFSIGTIEQADNTAKEARLSVTDTTIKDFADQLQLPTTAQAVTAITGFATIKELDSYAASLPTAIRAHKIVATAINKQRPLLPK